MRHVRKYFRVALSLFMTGSAILLFSCDEGSAGGSSVREEARMTEYSEDLSVVMSQNGRRSYHFVTPLLEGYAQAREPYREFRRGVKITTYQDDSLTTVDAVLTSNYAIYYTDRELWEARGDVVVEKSDGKTLYTQQLFWNARTRKIYSNVDSKIVQSGGRDVFIGEGFESDEEFKDWRFRRMKGRMEVNMMPGEQADSTASGPEAASRAASGASAEPAERTAPAAPASPAASERRPQPAQPQPARLQSAQPQPARPKSAQPQSALSQSARPQPAQPQSARPRLERTQSAERSETPAARRSVRRPAEEERHPSAGAESGVKMLPKRSGGQIAPTALSDRTEMREPLTPENRN